MPKAWGKKREHQYQAIRKSAINRGKSEEKAEEIAARTVNKQRRESGETPNKRTQGTGNPNTRLESRTRQELYNQAKKLNITGRSSMKKGELIKAIREKR